MNLYGYQTKVAITGGEVKGLKSSWVWDCLDNEMGFALKVPIIVF